MGCVPYQAENPARSARRRLAFVGTRVRPLSRFSIRLRRYVGSEFLPEDGAGAKEAGAHRNRAQSEALGDLARGLPVKQREHDFREGLREGEKDGRSRDPFRYQDEGDFRRADIGYRRQYGDLGRYRQLFRQGFTDGYTQGYRRFNSGYGGYGSYGNVGPGPYGYPGGRAGRYPGAFEIGARDGFEKGREDVRDNDRYDPRRHKWYREGDHDYNDRYGSRDRYKDEYRRGFLSGYERGYREGRYR